MELTGNMELIGYKNKGVIIHGLIGDVEKLPMDVATGSEFLALDTGQKYVFSGESWFESEGV